MARKNINIHFSRIPSERTRPLPYPVTLYIKDVHCNTSALCETSLSNPPLNSAIDPVEFSRRLRIASRILPTHGQSHRMPSPNITAHDLVVQDVLFDLPFQLDRARQLACIPLTPNPRPTSESMRISRSASSSPGKGGGASAGGANPGCARGKPGGRADVLGDVKNAWSEMSCCSDSCPQRIRSWI